MKGGRIILPDKCCRRVLHSFAPRYSYKPSGMESILMIQARLVSGVLSAGDLEGRELGLLNYLLEKLVKLVSIVSMTIDNVVKDLKDFR